MHMKLINIAVDAAMIFNVYTHFLPVVSIFLLKPLCISIYTFIPNGTKQIQLFFFEETSMSLFSFCHNLFSHSFCMLQIICKLVLFIYPNVIQIMNLKVKRKRKREIFMLVCVLCTGMIIIVCTISYERISRSALKMNDALSRIYLEFFSPSLILLLLLLLFG